MGILKRGEIRDIRGYQGYWAYPKLGIEALG